jgi:hypothetical protein
VMAGACLIICFFSVLIDCSFLFPTFVLKILGTHFIGLFFYSLPLITAIANQRLAVIKLANKIETVSNIVSVRFLLLFQNVSCLITLTAPHLEVNKILFTP